MSRHFYTEYDYDEYYDDNGFIPEEEDGCICDGCNLDSCVCEECGEHCNDCICEDSGVLSDYQERMAERSQMGLCNF